jgi:hypothetical protein
MAMKIKIVVLWVITLHSFIGVTNFSEVPSASVELEDEGNRFL